MAGRPSISFSNLSRQYIQNMTSGQSELVKLQDENKKKSKILTEYIDDPVGYSKDILKVYWWKKQREVALAMVKYNRVLVRSSHLVGKSYLGGGLINWAFDTHNPLSGVVSAPTIALVKDVLFSEARHQRKTYDAWAGTKAPILQDTDRHVIRGVVPSDSTSLQGRHEANMFLMVDEATGVTPEMFEAMESLYEGSRKYWVCFYNPTDPSAMVHHLETTEGWHVITISAMEHPNILYAIKNPDDPRIPIPGAISLRRFRELMRQWSMPVEKAQITVTDVCIPDEEGNEEWLRPGPIAEARLLARWPSQSYNSVWSDSLFDSISKLVVPINYNAEMIEIGCDVARFGSDTSAIVSRCGPVILDTQEYSGLDGVQVAHILKNKADELGSLQNIEGFRIPIKVDENGPGVSVVDTLFSYNYNVIPIDVNRRSSEPEKYNTLRTELWFQGMELAKEGKVSLYKIDDYDKFKLRKELVAPHYKINAKGQMVVESKEDTKKRTKQPSPNVADAFNLCIYAEAQSSITITVDKR